MPICTVLVALFTTSTAPSQPNFVVLIADDLGYGEIAPGASAAEIPTPSIDAIDDLVFRRAYVTAPNCSPSRAGFLAGQFPTRFGYEFNPVGPRNEHDGIGLPPEVETLPEALQKAGYATGLIGKWHLGGTADYHPHRHGFDRFFGFLHEGHYFKPYPYDGVTTWLRRAALPGGRTGRWTRRDSRMVWSDHLGRKEPDYDADNPILSDGQPVAEPDYLTDAFTREAVAFIRQHREQPFYLQLAYSAVHSPMQALDEDMAAFESFGDIQRRIFAGMLASLDRSVGQVVAAVDEAGVADRTVVVFFSDNGGPTAELTSSNAPLRGGKMDMYEGGIRVPMRIDWPAAIPRGNGILSDGGSEANAVDAPVSTLDLHETIRGMAATGGDAKQSRKRRDGLDLRTADETILRTRPLFWRQGTRAALLLGDAKIVRNGPSGDGAAGWERYDLAEDGDEATDLAAAGPSRDGSDEMTSRLAEVWDELNSAMSAPLFGPRAKQRREPRR